MDAIRDRLHVEAPAAEPIIVLSRSFNAPRRLVWKVMTEPEHIARWWGPRSVRTTVARHDFRVGGAWRYEHHMADGNVYAFKGEFREIVPQERLVQTFAMEGMYEDSEIVETMTLDEVDGRTDYKVVSRFENMEGRDGMLASGMESGAGESLDKIAEILDELQRA